MQRLSRGFSGGITALALSAGCSTGSSSNTGADVPIATSSEGSGDGTPAAIAVLGSDSAASDGGSLADLADATAEGIGEGHDEVADATARDGDLEAAPPRTVVRKKGGGIWAFSGASVALADLQPSFFYTWAPKNQWIGVSSSVPFVPMIWGAKNMNAADLAAAKASGPTLLGFNEPDVGGQSNLSVQQALAFWPQLEATGQRLGSPAPGGAQAPTQPSGWLVQFMASAKSAGYRVDFICLHWYTESTDAVAATDQLKTFLQNGYAAFGLPIWLTEYSMLSWSGTVAATPAQEAAFATASTAMLDALPYVEQYAWYAMPPQGNFSLYNSDGTETVVGAAYKAGK